MKKKISKKYLSIALISATMLCAKQIEYKAVHSMPTGVEKDYYIWRLLAEPSTSKQQAKSIIHEASHLNKQLKKAYKKKTGEYPPKIKEKFIPTPNHIWKRRSRAKKIF